MPIGHFKYKEYNWISKLNVGGLIFLMLCSSCIIQSDTYFSFVMYRFGLCLAVLPYTFKGTFKGTAPLSVSGQQAASLPTEINGIYKMPNKTWHTLYFATVLDLEHQQTPLTTRWVAHFWKLKFRVVLRTGLWMRVASHSEAGRGNYKWAKYPRQDQ